MNGFIIVWTSISNGARVNWKKSRTNSFLTFNLTEVGKKTPFPLLKFIGAKQYFTGTFYQITLDNERNTMKYKNVSKITRIRINLRGNIFPFVNSSSESIIGRHSLVPVSIRVNEYFETCLFKLLFGSSGKSERIFHFHFLRHFRRHSKDMT